MHYLIIEHYSKQKGEVHMKRNEKLMRSLMIEIEESDPQANSKFFQ